MNIATALPFLVTVVLAPLAQGKTFDIPLWPEGKTPDAQDGQDSPSLRVTLPDSLKCDATLIVAPGGSYQKWCAWESKAADFFSARGMATAVLRYRTPRPKGRPKHISAWQDAQRAVRLVRAHAKDWGVNAENIGFMGFSAGGNLTMLAATSSLTPAYRRVDSLDGLPCHVNWAVACYSAYMLSDCKDFDGGNRQKGNPLDLSLDPNFAFDAKTPPMCFLHGDADGHSPMGSVRAYHRLRTMNIPAELHVFAKRAHADLPRDTWKELVWSWLEKLKFVTVAAASVPSAVPDDARLTKPDYIVYVPRQRREQIGKTDPREIGDTYNDHFQVLHDDRRKLYYAFWTQASWEGAGDHHIVFSKSADGGKTWTAPFTLAGSERRAAKRMGASWQQPMLSRSGRLYCYWNQKVMQGGCSELLYGFYSDDAGETWSDPVLVPYPRRPAANGYIARANSGWINWQRPLRLGADGRYFTGCTRGGEIEFWQYENIDDDPPAQDLRISFLSESSRLSRARLAETCDYVLESGECRFEEASVVKLPDGRLFALMRTQAGHPAWSVSADGGRSWRDPKFLRPRDGAEPYLHPCSPCPIYDWKGPEAGSGTYFAFIHNTFDFANRKRASVPRGALYLIAGKFNPKAEQPIEFAPPKFFLERKKAWNSLYTSYTVVGDRRILWYPDAKYYLLGREIGAEWFRGGGGK